MICPPTLRQRRVYDGAQVRYLLYEFKGDLTVVPKTAGPIPELVRLKIQGSVGWIGPRG